MNFFRRNDLQTQSLELLAEYDRGIREQVGPRHRHPVRMRDWELCRVLSALTAVPREARILDTGSFNTYLGLHLRQTHPDVTVSDLLRTRAIRSLQRRVGLAPRKPTEIGYWSWHRLMRRHGVKLRHLDLTRTGLPDASFECIISISVIEHIPEVERAVAEMYRVLAPGGRLLLTTDCAPEPRPFDRGVRYFSEGELRQLFSPYPVTSPSNAPDFSRENWCYGGRAPVVTAFVEIMRPH